MSESVNNHVFTFISPYGTTVEIKGYSYEQLHDGGKIVQYEVKRQGGEHVATIPGDWLFVRLGDECVIHD